MKKQVSILVVIGVFLLLAAPVFAQDDAAAEATAAEGSFHQIVKNWFIDGGVEFMWPILITFILGLAISIERIITLNLARTNTKKLLARIEEALSRGGIEAAKEVTRDTRGPVASIFHQGLLRANEGADMVEKSVTSYGGVEMGRMERGLIWISLCISLGPMLGFFGTVIGMVQSFDAIEAAGDISPQIVAAGMKVALITTVGGLVVGMVLQVLYNYLVSTIDGLVNSMEDASISLVDIIVKHNLKK
jgi:biopolymer transport protein ExbB